MDLDAITPAVAVELAAQGAVGSAADVVLERRAEGGRSSTTLILSDGAQRFVVRVPFGGGLRQIEREFQFLRALADTPIPAPRPVAAGEVEVAGRSYAYCVTRFVDGIVPQEATGPTRDWLMEPDRKGRFLRDAARILGELHRLDWAALGLPARRGDFLDSQLRRWSGILGAAAMPETVGIDEVTRWLLAHRPESPPDVLMHGDFGLHNTILAADGSDTVVAVLDWELAAIGNPLCDLAWFDLQLGSTGSDWGNPAAPMMQGEGVPSTAELAEIYADASGVAVGSLEYYRVFSQWKSVALWASRFRTEADTGANDGFIASLRGRVAAYVARLVDQLPDVQSG